MNRVIISVCYFVLGAILYGAEIKGAFWSYNDPQIQVRRMHVFMSGDHIGKPWQLKEMDFINYELVDGSLVVSVWDGMHMVLHPKNDSDTVLAARKKLGRTFWIDEVLCKSQDRFFAGILVSAMRPAGEPREPNYGTPSVYISVEAKELAVALAAVKRVVLGSRFLPANAREQIELDEEMKKFVAEDWIPAKEPN